MLTILNIAKEKRAEADEYLEGHEAWARKAATQFSSCDYVKFGPVRRHNGRRLFDLMGMSNTALIPLTVHIAEDMPECDVWCIWAGTFEIMDLHTECDPGYQALTEEAADAEEEREEAAAIVQQGLAA